MPSCVGAPRAMTQRFGAAHGLTVVLIFFAAHKADLVMAAGIAAARPGELMSAIEQGERFHDLVSHASIMRRNPAPENGFEGHYGNPKGMSFGCLSDEMTFVTSGPRAQEKISTKR